MTHRPDLWVDVLFSCEKHPLLSTVCDLAYLATHKYAAVAVLPFHYCLRSLLTSWTVNTGMVDLLQVSEWERKIQTYSGIS